MTSLPCIHMTQPVTVLIGCCILSGYSDFLTGCHGPVGAYPSISYSAIGGRINENWQGRISGGQRTRQTVKVSDVLPASHDWFDLVLKPGPLKLRREGEEAGPTVYENPLCLGSDVATQLSSSITLARLFWPHHDFSICNHLPYNDTRNCMHTALYVLYHTIIADLVRYDGLVEVRESHGLQVLQHHFQDEPGDQCQNEIRTTHP